MSEPTLDWLKTLCHEDREAISTPFSVNMNGEKMVGATDGHALTLLRIDADASPFNGAQEVVGQFASAQWGNVPFAQVEAWATRQNDGRCEECAGLGFIRCPELQAFDSEGMGPIGDLWRPCYDCRWSLRIGTIAGVRIDRMLLLRFLGPLKTDEVAVASAEGKTGHMVALRAPGWMVVVMACQGVEPGEVFEVRPDAR